MTFKYVHTTSEALANPRQARTWMVLASHKRTKDGSVVTYLPIRAASVSDAESAALGVLISRKIVNGQVEQLTRVNP